jgi:hypothetical protein
MMELRHATHLEGWFSEWCHLPLRQAHWHTLIFRAPAGGPRPAGGSDATGFGEDGAGSLHAATTRGGWVHLGAGVTLWPVPSSGAETQLREGSGAAASAAPRGY